jgi:hypothetical protein
MCKTIYNKAARRRQLNLKSYWISISLLVGSACSSWGPGSEHRSLLSGFATWQRISWLRERRLASQHAAHRKDRSFVSRVHSWRHNVWSTQTTALQATRFLGSHSGVQAECRVPCVTLLAILCKQGRNICWAFRKLEFVLAVPILSMRMAKETSDKCLEWTGHKLGAARPSVPECTSPPPNKRILLGDGKEVS